MAQRGSEGPLRGCGESGEGEVVPRDGVIGTNAATGEECVMPRNSDLRIGIREMLEQWLNEGRVVMPRHSYANDHSYHNTRIQGFDAPHYVLDELNNNHIHMLMGGKKEGHIDSSPVRVPDRITLSMQGEASESVAERLTHALRISMSKSRSRGLEGI